LPPFTPAEWYLTLDEFQYVQLQHRVWDPENSFQDSLVKSRQILRDENHKEFGWTHGAFVLYKHPDSVRPMFRQFLHNLGEIYGGKEIPPRELCQKFNLLFMLLSIRQSGGSRDDLP
jgi:hypothetical protein